MIKKIILVFVLAFMIQSISAQILQAPGGTLLKQLAESKPDTTRIRILIQVGYYYYYQRGLASRPDSMDFYLRQARQLNENFHVIDFQNQINILYSLLYCVRSPDADPKPVFLPVIDSCRKTKDLQNEARAWGELADHIGNDLQSIPFKITCHENAMLLHRQLKNKTLEMNSLRFIADIHFQQRKYDLAESELLQILKEEKNIQPLFVMFTYDLLVALYTVTGKYDKALSYGLKTQKLMELSGDSSYAVAFYFRLANLYKTLGKPVQSIEWGKKALNRYISDKNFVGAFATIRFIANILLDEHKADEALKFVLGEITKRKPITINEQRIIQQTLGNCYSALEKYDMAEKCFLELIRLGNAQTYGYSPIEKGFDNFITGQFYFKTANYNKAVQFLEISLKNYKEFGKLQDIINVHLWFFKADSALGNYLAAIKHLEQKNLLEDSIFTIAKNKQVEELQIVYETEKKDKDFKILEGKENLAKAQLQQIKISRNWMIAGVSMLLIIAGLLFRQSRLRKRNNKIIKTKNEQLQHFLTEKERLLKEIHHRVKNNLQIVMSLLNSQSAHIDNVHALTAIHDSQHRVHAMSLIHQKLYSSENLSSIDMSYYVRELVSYLRDSFDTGQRIRFELNIEPLQLDVSQAVPIGLILNEAITNSIKYAFPDDKEGLITISLSNTNLNDYLLTISDNGIGMPVQVKDKKLGSLGMSLMAGLSEDLDGTFSIENNNGTLIKVSFIHDISVRRPDTLTASLIANN